METTTLLPAKTISRARVAARRGFGIRGVEEGPWTALSEAHYRVDQTVPKSGRVV